VTEYAYTGTQITAQKAQLDAEATTKTPPLVSCPNEVLGLVI